MNNEEAILVLKSTSVNLGRRSGKTAYAEALEMAITALQELDKNPTKPNNSTEKVNNSTATQFNGIESKVKGLTACRVLEDDAISRRQAIDEKKILDMTCGGRSIWFNKSHPSAIYCDKRKEMHEHLWKNAGNCKLIIDPDVICDFTNLPFEDSSFSLVVFDPPHLTTAKETSWLVKKYGKLDENWPEMLREGFLEGMRVLKKDGVLIFKWSECNIPSAEVWKAIGQKPLFGHHSGKKSNTFWACFMKGQK